MAKMRLLPRLKRLLLSRKRRRAAGFTLLELLISMIVGSIISLALLSLILDLNRANQLDTARSETQRDVQLAMNYIAQELRESVFVYDGVCLQGTGGVTASTFSQTCPGVVNHIPAGMSSTTQANPTTPVLAFWRADPLPEVLQSRCRANSTDLTAPAVANVPCVSGRTYTLVVYALVDDKQDTDIWQGRARLVRYQLTQFDSAGNPNPSYVDPLRSQTSTFQQWPLEVSGNTVVNNQTQRPTGDTIEDVIGTGNAAVLTDFIDDNQNPASAPSRSPTIDASNQPCPNEATAANVYAISPRTDASFNPAFYACVRGRTMTTASNTSPPTTEGDVNQEVVLTLTGNAENRVGLQTNIPPSLAGAEYNQRYRDRFLFKQQTRVMSRGIINKNPRS